MNRLKVNKQQTILALHEKGWSIRRITRELEVDRATVRRYLRGADSKSPGVQTGVCASGEPKSPGVQTGSQSASSCARWEEYIVSRYQAGHSLKRIHEDLKTECGFAGGYHAVRRFVRRQLPGEEVLPFRRMECAPAEELQVDFGQGAWIEVEGKRRRPHLFRCVLGFSRKGYSEVVWRQDTESFLRALENAFRHFGGVTRTVVIDNLKAGVLRTDWYDPELNPKLEEFARHYGTVILPCKPGMARHKGKVEAGVKYVQNNALHGRSFKSLAEQNLFLAGWEQNTAGKRIHGTTRKQVDVFFQEAERAALLALPGSVFPSFEEARRSVHRDGYVEYKKAYYSAPPEYVGLQVWVRQESRLLRIYNLRREQIAVHAVAEAGAFTTDQAHLDSRKRHIIERGAEALLGQCRKMGPLSGAWAEGVLKVRGAQGLRVMQGLLRLGRKYTVARVEEAARVATVHGNWRLRGLVRLLEAPSNVVQMDFMGEHPLIRPLDCYGVGFAEAESPEAAVVNAFAPNRPESHPQNSPQNHRKQQCIP